MQSSREFIQSLKQETIAVRKDIPSDVRLTFEDWYQWRKWFRKNISEHWRYCDHPDCSAKREQKELDNFNV